jgi:predicted DCC family thiol-disulfide oxidoreductase YuxK
MDRVSLDSISYQHPIILFDGECILCNHAIQFIINKDKTKIFKFMALQTAQKIAVVDVAQGPDSIILWKKGNILYQSDAILETMSELGNGYRFLGKIGKIFPRIIRNGVYSLIAKTRYRIWGKMDKCMMPPKDWKDRFIG